MKLPSASAAVAAAGKLIDRLKADTNAARILTEWIGSGGDPVSKDLAYRRAETCIACPHNQPGKVLESGIAEAIREQDGLRRGHRLTLSNEGKLKSCDICGCYLKLKVWVPMKHLSPRTRMADFPAHCWLPVEAEARRKENAAEARAAIRVAVPVAEVKKAAAAVVPKSNQAVRIRRTAAFGDVLMVLPLIDKLAAKGVTVTLNCAAMIAPILKGHPSIRTVVTDKSAPYEIDLDASYEQNQERMHKSVQQLFVEASAHQLKKVGIEPVEPTNLVSRIRIEDREKQEILKRGAHIQRPWICINYRSQSWPSRSVDERSLVAAAKKINGSCIWTHPGPVPDGLHSIKTNSFRELMALLSVSDLCITPDSGPMHAAAVVGCPIIALEQSIPIALRLSNLTDHITLSAPVECVRCLEWKCPKDEKKPPCQVFDPVVIADAANKRLSGYDGISAVIPVYKQHPRLDRCIKAIPDGVEVVVSLDGPDKFSVNGADIVLPSTGKRVGFGKTCTRGARASNGEFLLFLNDDCYLNPGAVEKMKEEMKPDVAVVGCLLRYPDGRIQHGGTVRLGIEQGYGHIDHGKVTPSITTPKEMEFVTFAAVLVRRKAFFDVGGFDEDYDTYCEDSDLCLRLRKAGWKVVYTPHASAIHDESQTTSPMKGELWRKSQDVFMKKWRRYFLENAGNQMGR
jgi:GT2 family glycosyltransferase/ADP-heptose:LPS heptosyltransferase